MSWHGDESTDHPNRFASFSPKFFDDGVRQRFEPGYFDTQSGGLVPPQSVQTGDKSQYIDSRSGEQPY